MDNLEFGISTTVLREHPVSYTLARIAEAGYRSAEIWGWHLERFPEPPARLAALAERLGLLLTFHAPTGDINPTAADSLLARRSEDALAASLHLAAELGAGTVALHPGRKSSPEESGEAVWDRLTDWVGKVDALASRLGVVVGLELMEQLPLEVFMTPQDAARLMALPLSRVGLTVDVAHMNTHGDPPDFLSALEPAWIRHVHLSDNAPHRVHLPLGEGEIDLPGVLAAVGRVYEGVISIEGSVPGEGETLLVKNINTLRALGYAGG